MHAALQNASADPLLKQARVMELFESLLARLLKPSPQAIPGTLLPQQLLRVRDGARLAAALASHKNDATLGWRAAGRGDRRVQSRP
jgi:hypothetical protein